jgi:FlaA1/EpsC-like NDP-sugar epimerase
MTTTATKLDQAAYRFLSSHRQVVAYTFYAAATAFAYALAFLVRFEFTLPPEHLQTFLLTLPILIGVRLVSNALFRLAIGRWRYVGVSDVFRLLGATILGSLVFSGVLLGLPATAVVPKSVMLIEMVLTTYIVGGVWFGYRLVVQHARHRAQAEEGRVKKVLIIGAGEAGSRLAHEMVTFPAGYVPLGFVDDDPLKWGTRIHGIEVVGSTSDIAAIAGEYRPDVLVAALPSLEPVGMRRVVTLCEPTGLPVKVLPGIAEVLEGDIRLNQLRDVRVEDLLGRDPVELSLPELAEDFRDRTVLITGAAGSIGSELSRQVARHGPNKLILLDQAESSLYFLELELRKRFPEVDVLPIVGDILDRELIESIFASEPVHRTFHAAAYKHVPLMETNVRQAVRNNVLGTLVLAETAGRHGCERFVLISTDKAVRPVNTMGATKSVAELLVLAAQRVYPRTDYMAVRFGNVLGSQGSVLPLFRRQMEEGDQLTVTHPEVTRFFMTIPEASQLVLQASLLREAKGRIAMLDMGEPIRILDLARNLIRLSGEFRDPDTRIRYVGLRPGEKLHEELIAPREEVTPTAVPKVNLVARSQAEGVKDLTPWIDRWRLGLGDPQLRAQLDGAWSWCSGASAHPGPAATEWPRRWAATE